AINYGGRDEIARAVRRMMRSYAEQPFDIDETVTEQFVADHLDTAGIPDPDLLIRTSGELRISNFRPWQIAYSEIYVTDLLWPDFSMTSLEDAILAYNGRERRFGGRKA
ncbi:MAG: undecaprenyl diphosphate synthase family protein, partial [Stomatobaculum sp.]|nr:undecaprenyl diphosphate synthase family protein [Stomatobaculum sp.]